MPESNITIMPTTSTPSLVTKIAAGSAAVLLTAITAAEGPAIIFIEGRKPYGETAASTFAAISTVPLFVMELHPIYHGLYKTILEPRPALKAMIDYARKHPLIFLSVAATDFTDSTPGTLDGSNVVGLLTGSEIARKISMPIIAAGLGVNFVFAYGQRSAEFLEQVSNLISCRSARNPLLEPLLAEELQDEIPRWVRATAMLVTTVYEAPMYYLSMTKLASVLANDAPIAVFLPVMPVQWLKTMGSLQDEFADNLNVFRKAPLAMMQSAINQAFSNWENRLNFVLSLIGAAATGFLAYSMMQDFAEESGLLNDNPSEQQKSLFLALQITLFATTFLTYVFSIGPRFYREEHALAEEARTLLVSPLYRRHRGISDTAALTPNRVTTDYLHLEDQPVASYKRRNSV